MRNPSGNPTLRRAAALLALLLAGCGGAPQGRIARGVAHGGLHSEGFMV